MELTASAEGRHPKLVDGKVHEVIRYRFGVGAKPRSAVE
jgi:hypothetical protein